MNDIERQRSHFESIALDYYLKRQSKNHLFLKHLLWSYFFKNKDFLKQENLLVLEPMCGYSEGKVILETHLNIKINYEGFDYSQTLVDEVVRNKGENVYLMDVTKFRPQKKYDLIILIGGLHHVPAYVDAVVKNLSQCLNSGGYFISFEPTHNNVLFKKIRQKIYEKNNLFDDETEQAFDLVDLNSFFLSNGFEVVDQIYPGLSSYVFYYNPDAFPRLNKGSCRIVNMLFSLDKLFFRNFVGKKLSFATMSLFKKC